MELNHNPILGIHLISNQRRNPVREIFQKVVESRGLEPLPKKDTSGFQDRSPADLAVLS